MSSNPLTMDYEGGDLLLAGAACGRLLMLGHCAGLCVQALDGDRKAAWRLSFSDEKRVRGVYTRKCKSTSYLTLPSLTNTVGPVEPPFSAPDPSTEVLMRPRFYTGVTSQTARDV